MDSHEPASGGARSRRGEQRRDRLLELVVADVTENGLVDFSLRRAARAAGTTHKVLLYHFGSGDELLRQALSSLRAQRIAATAVSGNSAGAPLSERIRAVWEVLLAEPGPRVLDQASGLAMYDPERYSGLGRDATEQYLPPLVALCPGEWDEARKLEVATMVLAVLRGLLLDALTGGDRSRIDSGLRSLSRALEAEQLRSDGTPERTSWR